MTRHEEAEKVFRNLQAHHAKIAAYLVQRCGEFTYDAKRVDLISEFLHVSAEVGLRAPSPVSAPLTTVDLWKAVNLSLAHPQGWPGVIRDGLEMMTHGETRTQADASSDVPTTQSAISRLGATSTPTPGAGDGGLSDIEEPRIPVEKSQVSPIAAPARAHTKE